MEPFFASGRLNEDVQRRLNNTILYYDGKPVYVRYVSGTMVQYWPLTTYFTGVNGTPIDYTDPRLTDRIPRLGYVNYEDYGALFILRIALREQRCGIPLEALSTNSNSHYLDTRSMVCAPFESMLLNKYPTITDAYATLRSVSSRRAKVAFSKNYAIDIRMNIYYQDRFIGGLVKLVTGGYDMEFIESISGIAFYRRNLCERFNTQLKEFKP